MSINWDQLIKPEPSKIKGPDVSGIEIDAAEERLGYRLPIPYREMLLLSNGCYLLRNFVPTPFRTSWHSSGFSIKGICGIGTKFGLDGELGSAYKIEEWEYPSIGVVFGLCPSAGHDVVMLDYSEVGEGSRQPSIAYVDEDRIPKIVAKTFEGFIEMLTVEQSE